MSSPFATDFGYFFHRRAALAARGGRRRAIELKIVWYKPKEAYYVRDVDSTRIVAWAETVWAAAEHALACGGFDRVSTDKNALAMMSDKDLIAATLKYYRTARRSEGDLRNNPYAEELCYRAGKAIEFQIDPRAATEYVIDCHRYPRKKRPPLKVRPERFAPKGREDAVPLEQRVRFNIGY